jgi:hypothetical protein
MVTNPSGPQTFETWHCSRLSYRITVESSKFEVQRFAEAIGNSTKLSEWDSVILAARDPQSTGYHLHVYWRRHRDDPEKTQLQVDYYTGSEEADDKRPAPSAEAFFEWVGGFFREKTVTAHIHGEFEYPIERWQSKIMALPLKVPYGDKGALIDGLSIALLSEPEGIKDLWIHLGRKLLAVQLFADRQLTFANFTPYVDISALALVLKTLVEEKTQ